MKNKPTVEGYFSLEPVDTYLAPAGKVEFNERNTALTLLGTLVSESNREGTFRKAFERIYGFTSLGNRITLIGCHGHTNNSIPGIVRTTLTAEFYIEGRQYFQPEDKIITASFQLSGFDQWLNRTGVEPTLPNQDFDNFQVRYSHPGEIPLFSTNTFSVYAWHHTYVPMSYTADVLSDFIEEAHILVKYKTGQKVDSIVDDIQSLKNFFTILIAKPTTIKSCQIVSTPMANKNESASFEIRFGSYYSLYSESYNQLHMTIPFSTENLDWDKLFNNWILLNRSNDSAIDLCMRAYHMKYENQYHQFLDLTFSFESLHRTTYVIEQNTDQARKLLDKAIANLSVQERTELETYNIHIDSHVLRKRLKMSIGWLNQNDLNSKKVNQIVNLIVDTRNLIVHQAKFIDKKCIPEDILFRYNALLRVLVFAEIIKTLFDDDESKALNQTKRDFYYRNIFCMKKL